MDVTNVHEGASYAFRVCAENAMGKGPWVECPAVLCQDPVGKLSDKSNIKVYSKCFHNTICIS